MSRTSDRTYRANRARLLARSTLCHICGHPDADSADHLTPYSAGGTDRLDNLAPAHLKPCPTCGERCNLRKHAKTHAPIVRRSGSLAPAAPQGG